MRRALPALLLFLAVLAVHARSRVVPAWGDSSWTLPTALSILRAGDTDVDEYTELLATQPGYAITVVNGHRYSLYPLGTTIAVLPFVWALRRVPRALPFLVGTHNPADGPPGKLILANRPRVERLLASVFVAICAVWLYRVGRRTAGPGAAMLAALTFAFATPAWSCVSRMLWQHGPSMLCNLLAMDCLLQAEARPRRAPLAAIPLAFSYVVRPTNAVPIAVLTVYVFWKHRPQLIRYCLYAAPIAIAFFAYNRLVLREWLPFYYRGMMVLDRRVFEALAGHVLSPARGLLSMSPVLLYAIAGAIRLRREPIARAFVVIVLLHWLAVSAVPMWWGGHQFGARYMTDVLPYVCWLLLPSFADLVASLRSPDWRTRLAVLGFAALLAFSVFVHARGANSGDVAFWNAWPTDIDRSAHRVWDWDDPPFLRGL